MRTDSGNRIMHHPAPGAEPPSSSTSRTTHAPRLERSPLRPPLGNCSTRGRSLGAPASPTPAPAFVPLLLFGRSSPIVSQVAGASHTTDLLESRGASQTPPPTRRSSPILPPPTRRRSSSTVVHAALPTNLARPSLIPPSAPRLAFNEVSVNRVSLSAYRPADRYACVC